MCPPHPPCAECGKMASYITPSWDVKYGYSLCVCHYHSQMLDVYNALIETKKAAGITEITGTQFQCAFIISQYQYQTRAKDAKFDGHTMMRITLENNSILIIDLNKFPKLLNATKEQQENWRWNGVKSGIHWEELDEDLSIHGLVQDAIKRYSKEI